MPVKKTPITIHYLDHNRRKRSLVVDAEVHGLLAINRSMWATGAPIKGLWNVSHIPTGWSVISCLRLGEARRAMTALGGLDWPTSKQPKVTKARSDIRSAVASLRLAIDLERRRA